MAEQTKLRVSGENSTIMHRTLAFDESLCLRSASKSSKCKLCVDVCPGNAMRLPETKSSSPTKPTISKGFCVDCNLCAAACPTGAITVADASLRALRRKLKRAEATVEEGWHVYLTCCETGLAKDDMSVVEVNCLGMLTWEMWANLMLDFPKLGVYLPSDLCSRCKAKKAESMIVDEVVHAQEVVGRDLTLVETMRELDFTNRNGSLRVDRRTKMKESQEDSFGNILQDLTSKRVNPDDMDPEDLGPMDAKKMRIRLRKEITRAEGEDTPGLVGAEELGGTMPPARWALLDAVMRFPEIAPHAEIEYVTLDPDKLPEGAVERCARECPLGAIHVEADGSFSVNPVLCRACGLCDDICGAEGVGRATVICDKLLAR